MHSGRNERKQRHEQSVKRKYIRLIGYSFIGVTVLTLFGAYSLACSYVYVAPSLPSVEAMRKVEMQVPLRVFTTSGELIAQIGEQRRIPVTYDQIPPRVREASASREESAEHDSLPAQHFDLRPCGWHKDRLTFAPATPLS